jgi:hypothetical protein
MSDLFALATGTRSLIGYTGPVNHLLAVAGYGPEVFALATEVFEDLARPSHTTTDS